MAAVRDKRTETKTDEQDQPPSGTRGPTKNKWTVLIVSRPWRPHQVQAAHAVTGREGGLTRKPENDDEHEDPPKEVVIGNARKLAAASAEGPSHENRGSRNHN